MQEAWVQIDGLEGRFRIIPRVTRSVTERIGAVIDLNGPQRIHDRVVERTRCLEVGNADRNMIAKLHEFLLKSEFGCLSYWPTKQLSRATLHCPSPGIRN